MKLRWSHRYHAGQKETNNGHAIGRHGELAFEYTIFWMTDSPARFGMTGSEESLLRKCLLEDRTQLRGFLSDYKQRRSTESLVSLVNTRLQLASHYDRHFDYTPLGYAIIQNDQQSVDILMRNGACARSIPCSSVDNDIVVSSHLHLALTNQCQPTIIDTLLKYGAITTYIRKRDVSCLFEYLVKCPSKVTTSALMSGVSADATTDENKKRTLLHLAAMNRNSAIVSNVLETGQVNVDKFDAVGKTALMYAAEHNAPAVVLLLLDYGATVDLTDASGRTALHFAVRRACLKTVELLMSAGANVGAEDRKGLTPITYALSEERLLHTRSTKGSAEDLIECLARSNENPVTLCKRDFVGVVFLLVIICETESVIIKLLEDNSCHMFQQNDDGKMLIHVAAEFNKHRVVKWLIEKGSLDSDTLDAAGWLPFHYAAKGGNRETLFYLLEQHGADVNSATPGGWTSLWILTRNGWTDLACDVVRYGCDVQRTLNVIALRLADSHFSLPLSLFGPAAQRMKPVAYARSGSRSISIVEFCTEWLRRIGGPFVENKRRSNQ
ncbi:hypothetical protein LSAT2_012613 [Lamellibrachia satsuma]|nr:hypothetical protein LSAT2_012613 [Lamellibrachia satsuma]